MRDIYYSLISGSSVREKGRARRERGRGTDELNRIRVKLSCDKLEERMREWIEERGQGNRLLL